MLGLAVGGAAALAGAVGVAAAVSGRRFERRVDDDARLLFSQPCLPAGPLARLDALPLPVRRYLEVSGATRRPPIVSARLRHGGTFVAKVGGAPMPIRGLQYFTADPPGFVWWGRVRAGRGVWIDARDQVVVGEASMVIRAESLLTLADARGPELDQGALLRLLGEATWMPTLLRDPRFVSWKAIDGASAEATLRVGGREATGTFHFGPHGLPTLFTAERFREVDKVYELTRFSGVCADFREVAGVQVPFRVTAIWHLDSGPLPYASWQVEELELDQPRPW